MRTLREGYMGITYMGSRKGQYLLSILGVWVTWERIEEVARGRKNGDEKYIIQRKQ